MSLSKQSVLNSLEQTGVVAVIRTASIDVLPSITEALLAGGVLAIEITMGTPKAIVGIEKLADRFGDRALIGVGTVLDPATAANAIVAGAQFVVSPGFDPQVVETTLRHGKVSIPGAFTPTEILRTFSAGGDIIKVFPSTTVGPGYFKDILAPLPQLRLTPTGGITLQNTPAWIQAGAVCVGVGTAIVSREAIARQDWPAITASARAFIETIRQARASAD